MKITIESYDKMYSTQTKHDDLTIEEYMDIFKGLLVSSGFSQNTVDEYFGDA